MHGVNEGLRTRRQPSRRSLYHPRRFRIRARAQTHRQGDRADQRQHTHPDEPHYSPNRHHCANRHPRRTFYRLSRRTPSPATGISLKAIRGTSSQDTCPAKPPQRVSVVNLAGMGRIWPIAAVTMCALFTAACGHSDSAARNVTTTPATTSPTRSNQSARDIATLPMCGDVNTAASEVPARASIVVTDHSCAQACAVPLFGTLISSRAPWPTFMNRPNGLFRLHHRAAPSQRRKTSRPSPINTAPKTPAPCNISPPGPSAPPRATSIVQYRSDPVALQAHSIP